MLQLPTPRQLLEPRHRARRWRLAPEGRTRGSIGFAIAAAALAAAAGPTRGAEIRETGQGPVEIAAGATGISELSGIAYAGGNRFYAVSDKGGRLFPLTIDLDRDTGSIGEVVPSDPVVLVGGHDLEGVALLGDDAVIVCDELGSILREHRIGDGSLIRQHRLPRVFRSARPNLGIESLTRTEDALWVANEEALVRDGDAASGDVGTRVRVQRLNRSGGDAGQWAYDVDPHPGSALFGRAFSGVADLLALPGGELLVLERSFSSAGFRARIYQVDFAGATRTGEVENLRDESVVPLGKRRLWESHASFAANFEGLALGPPLASGDSSLLLVADDGGVGPPVLMALRLRLAPAPPLASPLGESAGAPQRPPAGP